MKQTDIRNQVIRKLTQSWEDRDGNTITHSRDARNIFEMLLSEAKLFSVRMNGNSADRMATNIINYLEKYNL